MSPYLSSTLQAAPSRLFREGANLLGQTALMPCGLVAMNDALVDHAVDHRGGLIESRCGFRVLARLEREGRLTDRAAQLGGQRVIAGAVYRRLPCRFFRRFRIRQARLLNTRKPDGPPKRAA